MNMSNISEIGLQMEHPSGFLVIMDQKKMTKQFMDILMMSGIGFGIQ